MEGHSIEKTRRNIMSHTNTIVSPDPEHIAFIFYIYNIKEEKKCRVMIKDMTSISTET